MQPTERDLTKKFYVFNAMNCANFTVSSYYIYKVKQLPPKEL